MDNKNTFPKQLFYLSSIFMMVASLALSIYEIVMSSASYIPNGASDPAVWSLLTAVLFSALFAASGERDASGRSSSPPFTFRSPV